MAKEKSGQSGRTQPDIKLVAENRKARSKFEVLDTLECGLVLQGSEVKSLRQGGVSLDEAYARYRDGEMWLVGCYIPEYPQANQFNHDPTRPRKLLMHKREIRRFAGRAQEKGLTLVPLKIYFRSGKAKVLIGLCRGLKLHDKREKIREREAQRAIQRALRRR
ncbi:MAG: SsrA-binding protein SmpB [Thermoguttaceae bacterium]|nr:SsrA-binding protein SmpB [Thermoguttaceae bacterium]MDW8079114.1 SsrA-binding protein SmpB [Thermoguttaceae bacterium]